MGISAPTDNAAEDVEMAESGAENGMPKLSLTKSPRPTKHCRPRVKTKGTYRLRLTRRRQNIHRQAHHSIPSFGLSRRYYYSGCVPLVAFPVPDRRE